MSSSRTDPTRYRLQSGPMIHAPGIIRWAINGYAFPSDRQVMLDAITQCWKGVTEDAAHKLLIGEVPFDLEGDTVVFEA